MQKTVRSYRCLWWLLFLISSICFAILGCLGKEIYREAPPIPTQVVTENGRLLMTEEDILNGQTAWQSIGGMQLGSIWGHGAYQAPDWSADWLHRELTIWLDLTAQQLYHADYELLIPEQQTYLQNQLTQEYRTNTYNHNTGQVVVSERRASAMALTAAYYQRLFGTDPDLRITRQHYAMKEDTLPSLERRQQLRHFFFWTAWATSTNRLDSSVTYTNNWPHEPLINNQPTAENIIWSAISIVVLVAGIGVLIWAWAFYRTEEPDPPTPLQDPLSLFTLTPSQKALGKYAILVVGLFVFQVFLGGAIAHYTVEGQHFYGFELSTWFPYSLLRTWHIQSAMFWIASGFLTAGLFLAPIINGGQDPKGQKLGVNLLFIALLLVVVGSFIGNYLSIAQIMPEKLNFLLGHQGYEYIDLGRFWQIGLFVGLLLWLVLMLRAIIPALRLPGDKHLLILLTGSCAAIDLFYGVGFFYGERTHLSIMEYWRWWIVHLWVEGFFEVFTTAVLAFIFCNLGLVSKKSATIASLASASLFLVGGIPGTFHHLYFSGTTTPIMAVGASFSALEVVPLVILGYEARKSWLLQHAAPWMQKIKWPLLFFIAVSFWNMLGAGVFGFMINPPISLYYAQGLNTTPTHAHAALFGVYGLLALGFILLILRYLRPQMIFNERVMKTAFWYLNIGLILMLFTRVLPIGVIQFIASVKEGLWYARSEAFMQQDIIKTLRWVRTVGDVIFIIGTLAIAWQVVSGLVKPNQPNQTQIQQS